MRVGPPEITRDLRRPGRRRVPAHPEPRDARASRNAGCIASLSATAFAAITCSSGPPCIIGNTALSTAFACSSVQTIIAPRGPRSALCVVNVTTSACGTGEGAAGDQADEMGGIDPQQRTHLVGASSGTRRSPSPADRRCSPRGRSSDDAPSRISHLVHVELLGVLVDVVPDEVEPHPGDVDGRAVREMTAVGELHPEDRRGIVRREEHRRRRGLPGRRRAAGRSRAPRRRAPSPGRPRAAR